MITAVSRCLASMPNAIYAAMIPPETCAIPLVITVINSDLVSLFRKGRIVSGASVCPMKMLAVMGASGNADDHHHHADVIQQREKCGDKDDRRQHLKRKRRSHRRNCL